VSPLATLARGYAAISRVPGNETVGSAEELQEGDHIRVRFQDGAAIARVTALEEEIRSERK